MSINETIKDPINIRIGVDKLIAAAYYLQKYCGVPALFAKIIRSS